MNKSEHIVPEYVGQHIVSEDKSGYLRVTSPNQITKISNQPSLLNTQEEIFETDVNISQIDLFNNKNKSPQSKNLKFQNNSNEKS